MARTTDIYCPVCYSKAVITKAKRDHIQFINYYCACKNPNCGHLFVMNMEFSHTTRSSKLTKENLLKLTLNLLSKEDKDSIVKLLSEESR